MSPSQLAAVRELQDVLVAVAPRGAGVLSELQFDAVPAQGLAEPVAQRGGLARHHTVGALDDHRLAAEPVYDLRELGAGRSTAEHEHPARDLLHAGRLASTPHAVELTQPGDRGHERV